MRKAINDNPMVQIAVIGVLVLVVGFFMMTNLKKKSASSSSSGSSTPAASSTAGTGGTTVVPVSPSTSGSAGAVAPPATSGTVSPDALIPGPGLPKNVAAAWKGGDTIVLLIVRGGGTDDRLVRSSVDLLKGFPGMSVFVTRAKDVARYSRITQGAGVNRVPALVVVRPRSISGSVPEATVSYGFRNSQSVVQAVRDALYSGSDDLPYSPR
jgi:hypothetical protein